MIGFFRKIRKKLADYNKPAKYLRYAIVEIMWVLVGILMALHVNNWNETRKIQKEQHQLIKSIIEALDRKKIIIINTNYTFNK